MERIEMKKRIGIDGQDFVSAEQAKDMGFDIEESKNGKQYAVKYIEVEVPEDVTEAEAEFNYTDEEGSYINQVLDWVQQKARKLQGDREYRKLQSMLSLTLDKKVADYIESLYEQANMPFIPYDVELLDSMPFE